MKKPALLTLLILQTTYGHQLPGNTYYEVCFTPQHNCTRLIVHQIERAHHQILVQSYTFTSYRIADALIRAYKKGKNVAIILDKSQLKRPYFGAVKKLLNSKIPLWVDNKVKIAHNKVMIFDASTVETGSFNYTYSAQKYNAENVLIIDNKKLAAAYIKNWEQRQKVSERIN